MVEIFNEFHGGFKGARQPTLLDKYIKNKFYRPVPRKANRYTLRHSLGEGPGTVGLHTSVGLVDLLFT